jgi:putative transcriptional regulator
MKMGKAFESIRKGLKHAIAHQQGKRVQGLKVHRPAEIDVRAVRQGTGLTQEEFAAKFAISLGTLRHWERGDRKPRGATLVLLNVIAREPKAVMRALEVK